jgi:uracil-DNA glycosylase
MLCDLDFLAPGWRDRVGAEFDKPYVEELRAFLREEYRAGARVFPPKERIFAALGLVDYDEAKVVVLGQDPYHGPGQAMGLSFAVPDEVATPPSLRNIFKEVSEDLCVAPPRHTDLSGWAEQGVLLLNTVLTVRAGEAFSHRNKGWEVLTDRIFEELGAREKPLVFMLWGVPAQQKCRLIRNPAHLVLKAPHPSPLSAHRGFFGCKHFSQANAFLQRNGLHPIDWSRTRNQQRPRQTTSG